MTLNERREIVEAVTRKLLSKLGNDIETLRSAGIGVTIFAFGFEPGAIAYISTSNREDMIRAVKEWLSYQEAGLETEPRGERGKS